MRNKHSDDKKFSIRSRSSVKFLIIQIVQILHQPFIKLFCRLNAFFSGIKVNILCP